MALLWVACPFAALLGFVTVDAELSAAVCTAGTAGSECTDGAEADDVGMLQAKFGKRQDVVSQQSGDPSQSQPLLLTKLLDAGKADEARKAAEVVVDGTSLGYAGYLSVQSASEKMTNHMYFWYQPCTSGCDPGKANFLQYFGGGPGSGSMSRAMLAIGNWYADSEQGPLKKRCHSWCRDNNCLFVDSPVQAGLSYQVDAAGNFPGLDNVELTQTSEEAMAQMVVILTQFLQLFPELQPAPYFITGESYAGNYNPWMAKAVLANNAKQGSMKVNLKGLSVADPCLGWLVQMKHYADTLWTTGLLMEDERQRVAGIFERASAHLKEGDCPAFFKEWDSVWNDDATSPVNLFKELTGSEAPDMQLLGTQPPSNAYWMKWVEAHSNDLHFAGSPADLNGFSDWSSTCRKAIYQTMVKSGDFCQESAPMYFRDIFLAAGIDVMIYSGTLDLLLGPPTTEPGIRAGLQKAGLEEDFYKANKTMWSSSETASQPFGYARCMPGASGNRFCYTVVRNAGHDVPKYQPAPAYDLNLRFLGKKPFDQTWFDPTPPQCETNFQDAGFEIFESR